MVSKETRKPQKYIWRSITLLFFVMLAAYSLPKGDNIRISEYEMAETLAVQFYDAVGKADYETALGLLHREASTMFTDEFIISGSQEAPLRYYKVQTVKKLADGVYEISAIGEVEDGQGKREITNYAILQDSNMRFVIHWSDVPSDLFDFGEVIGF